MIIGITGTDGAGKGSVVDYLVNKIGYTHYSARAMFVEEIKRQGGELTSRNELRLMGNEFRKKYGNDFVASISLKKAKEDNVDNAVIESIRAVAEAETLQASGAVLLAVDADQKLRYERVQARRSESDQVSFEEFEQHEQLEMDDPDPNGMQKRAVMEMADCTIENNGTLEELHKNVDMFLSKYATV